MSAMSANKTKMLYKAAGGDTFTQLDGMMEVPEFGGAPEKIDVTTLSDGIKKYVNGIVDMGDLVFKFLYDNSSATSNYRVLRTMQENGETGEFKLTYPDGTGHEFKAQVSVKMDAAAVNGALTFSCTMNLQSEVTVTDPSEE